MAHDAHKKPNASTDGDLPEITWDAERTPIERIAVAALMPADSPRLFGEDDDHVQRLAASDAVFPPIVVHRSTMRVIDGMHRLHVAVKRKQESIDVRFFDGSEQDAFVLAVQLNITHGLPLTRSDRFAAADRILTMYPTWSDRLVASVTGLSTRTVRTLRRESDNASTVDARVGRDGRLRPIDPTAGRLAASRVVSERPDASLREIAREAGVSLATARDVRTRVQHGKDPLPALHRNRAAAENRNDSGDTRFAGNPDRGTDAKWEQPTSGRFRPPPSLIKTGSSPESTLTDVLNGLSRDPSLRFTENGRRLLRWLTLMSAALPEWQEIAPTVPPHSTYMVSDLARQCAAEWLGFAAELAKNTDMTG